jgi:hypothetical protein
VIHLHIGGLPLPVASFAERSVRQLGSRVSEDEAVSLLRESVEEYGVAWRNANGRAAGMRCVACVPDPKPARRPLWHALAWVGVGVWLTVAALRLAIGL